MRNLYNMIAIVAVAFTMFYLGRSCTLNQLPECPPAYIDTLAYAQTIKTLDSTMHVLDSIKEENREMDIIVVNQQNQLTITKDFLTITSRRAEQFAKLYIEAKNRKDAVSMTRNCDSIVEEYDTYRFTCDAYVQEADSIMSNMYVVNARNEQMIKDLDALVFELSDKYQECVTQSMIAATGENAEKRKKKRWRTIAIAAAALIGLNILTR